MFGVGIGLHLEGLVARSLTVGGLETSWGFHDQKSISTPGQTDFLTDASHCGNLFHRSPTPTRSFQRNATKKRDNAFSSDTSNGY